VNPRMIPPTPPPARVKWAARFFLLVLLAYPVAFYTWYFTADRVTATLERCDTIGIACRDVGTWTMRDGTPGGGDIVGGSRSPDGTTTVTIRATRTWAVADGVASSWLALLADGLVLAMIGATVLGIQFERRARRRYGGGG
jgi:hypothetical protein